MGRERKEKGSEKREREREVIKGEGGMWEREKGRVKEGGKW